MATQDDIGNNADIKPMTSRQADKKIEAWEKQYNQKMTDGQKEAVKEFLTAKDKSKFAEPEKSESEYKISEQKTWDKKPKEKPEIKENDRLGQAKQIVELATESIIEQKQKEIAEGARADNYFNNTASKKEIMEVACIASAGKYSSDELSHGFNQLVKDKDIQQSYPERGKYINGKAFDPQYTTRERNELAREEQKIKDQPLLPKMSAKEAADYVNLIQKETNTIFNKEDRSKLESACMQGKASFAMTKREGNTVTGISIKKTAQRESDSERSARTITRAVEMVNIGGLGLTVNNDGMYPKNFTLKTSKKTIFGESITRTKTLTGENAGRSTKTTTREAFWGGGTVSTTKIKDRDGSTHEIKSRKTGNEMFGSQTTTERIVDKNGSVSIRTTKTSTFFGFNTKKSTTTRDDGRITKSVMKFIEHTNILGDKSRRITSDKSTTTRPGKVSFRTTIKDVKSKKNSSSYNKSEGKQTVEQRREKMINGELKDPQKIPKRENVAVINEDKMTKKEVQNAIKEAKNNGVRVVIIRNEDELKKRLEHIVEKTMANADQSKIYNAKTNIAMQQQKQGELKQQALAPEKEDKRQPIQKELDRLKDEKQPDEQQNKQNESKSKQQEQEQSHSR